MNVFRIAGSMTSLFRPVAITVERDGYSRSAEVAFSPMLRWHRRVLVLLSVTLLIPCLPSAGKEPSPPERRLSLAEYRDKMAAAWIGQMAGVGWGGPTEFHYQGSIIPAEKMPAWKPELINQFNQDDIYVEMTFLRSLEQHGLACSIRQAGIDFADSEYRLWHANSAGRDNLRNGIAPPDSGHPKFNGHADDIDYQIEADFSGIIAPGLPNTVVELGNKFGRLMNYGDGIYGGQFVGGMYAEAFFDRDPVKLVEAGLRCIPAESVYAETIRDVLGWYREEPEDWQATWDKVDQKYHRDAAMRRFSCNGSRSAFNIDAKLNGAYIVMGLLYGGGDLDQTIIIATRCGQDSDCNPSNAAGILFTTIGFEQLPDRYTSQLDRSAVFSHTAYSFTRLLAVCEQLARQAVIQSGGRVERQQDGSEYLLIPVHAAEPGKLEQCWDAGPVAGSRFTEEELARIRYASSQKKLQESFTKRFPGWRMTHCGPDMGPGLKAESLGKRDVFLTHPQGRNVGCVLSKMVDVPAGRTTRLRIVTAHDPPWGLDIGGQRRFEGTRSPLDRSGHSRRWLANAGCGPVKVRGTADRIGIGELGQRVDV